MIDSADFIGRPVRSLQTMLRVATQMDKTSPTIIPDGIFGQNTAAAVRDFQKKNRLPVTGVADNATWDKLVAAYEAACIEYAPASPLTVIMQPGQVIHAGEWNYHLFLIQAMLAVLARIHANFPPVPVSGVLDPQTGKSIAYFQEIAGLPATGAVDKTTWQYLANHYTHAAGDGTGWAAQAPQK